jgi:hypothetical protein
MTLAWVGQDVGLGLSNDKPLPFLVFQNKLPEIIHQAVMMCVLF